MLKLDFKLLGAANIMVVLELGLSSMLVDEVWSHDKFISILFICTLFDWFELRNDES